MQLPFISVPDNIEPLQYFDDTDDTDFTYSVQPLYDDDSAPWLDLNSTTLLFDQTQISTINTNNLSTINSAIPEEVYGNFILFQYKGIIL